MGVWFGGDLVMVCQTEQEQCHLKQSAAQAWAILVILVIRAKKVGILSQIRIVSR